jgi:hypothetical protein
MKFSKYLIIAAALVCQQGYAAGKVIFKNNSGVDVTLDHTTPADRGVYHGAQPLKPGSTSRNFDRDSFVASDMSASHNISSVRVTYGNARTSFYYINIERIKAVIRNCQNGDVVVEIQPKRWFGSEAPSEPHCQF